MNVKKFDFDELNVAAVQLAYVPAVLRMQAFSFVNFVLFLMSAF